MPGFPLIHRILRGNWVDHVVTGAQIAVGTVAILGIIGWLTLNPFVLLSFVFAQPLVALGIGLFIFSAFFFERAFMLESYDAAEIVFAQGSPARSVYRVKSGTVDLILKRSSGEETSVATLGPGDYLGQMSLLPGSQYRFSARTRGASELINIRPRDFATIFIEMPEVREQMQKSIRDGVAGLAPELKNEVEQILADPEQLVRASRKRF